MPVHSSPYLNSKDDGGNWVTPQGTFHLGSPSNEPNEEAHGKGRIGGFIADDNTLKIKGEENTSGNPAL
jgi:hypothetical protein